MLLLSCHLLRILRFTPEDRCIPSSGKVGFRFAWLFLGLISRVNEARTDPNAKQNENPTRRWDRLSHTASRMARGHKLGGEAISRFDRGRRRVKVLPQTFPDINR